MSSDEAAQAAALHWYIEKYESAYGQSTIPFADQLRQVMSPSLRLRAKIAATDVQAVRARRTAAALAAGPGPLRLHLGCGWNHLDGWVNSDLVGGKGDFAWNILRPLPFAPGTVDVVFLEHVFEHMRYSQTLTVLGHVRQVLGPRRNPEGGRAGRRDVRPDVQRAAGPARRSCGGAGPRRCSRCARSSRSTPTSAPTTPRPCSSSSRRAGSRARPWSREAPPSCWTSVPDLAERIPETVYAEVRRSAD